MKQYRIEHICTIKSSRRIFANQYSTKGVPFFRGKEITQLSIGNTVENPLYISEKSFSDIMRNGTPQIDDILITAVGTIGSVWKVNIDTPFYFKDGNIIWLSNIDKNIVIPTFLKYYLQSKTFQHRIEEISIGSTQKALTIDAIKKEVVILPCIETQQHIVDILGTLDKKIENNNDKINKLLEFYFIEYKRMILGKECNSKLSEIATVESGKRPMIKQVDTNKEFNIPIIGASSIMGYTNDYLYNEPIIVIGRVGTHGVVQAISEKSWPSDNTLVIRTDYYSFVYNILSNIDYASINKGSTQPLITQTDIKNTPIVIPTKEDLLRFEKITSMTTLNFYKNEIAKLELLKQLYLKKFFG